MSALLQAIRLTGQNVTGDVKLLIAVKDSDVKAACRLLASGANANAVGANGWTPLHYACDIPHPRLAQILMFQCAEINTKSAGGLTPLHLSVDARSGEITEMLLRAGASVNAVDNGGNTPLHIASKRGDVKLGTQLIANGATVTVYKDVTLWTPIHEAAACGSVPMVTLLCAAGANVNSSDVLGLTPLHLAAKAGDEGMAVTLIRLGADALLTDGIGFTPAQLARRHNHDELAVIIAKNFNMMRRGWVLNMLHLIQTGRARMGRGGYQLPRDAIVPYSPLPPGTATATAASAVTAALHTASRPRAPSGEKRLRSECATSAAGAGPATAGLRQRVVATTRSPASSAHHPASGAAHKARRLSRSSDDSGDSGLVSAGAGAGAGPAAGAGAVIPAGEPGRADVVRQRLQAAHEDSVLRRLRSMRHQRAMSVGSDGKGQTPPAGEEPAPSVRARAATTVAMPAPAPAAHVPPRFSTVVGPQRHRQHAGRSTAGREMRRRWSAGISVAAVPPLPPSPGTDHSHEPPVDDATTAEALVRLAELVPDLQMRIIKML